MSDVSEHDDVGRSPAPQWECGRAPVAVIMITLNEAHNMEAVLENLKGWAQEVFLVDSFSSDATVDIALRHGVHVVQRRFRGFGDQWNFALSELPVSAPWTIKLDPDERLSAGLKKEIVDRVEGGSPAAYVVPIRLFFMTRALPVRLSILRLWRTGMGAFSAVAVNEHVQVAGEVGRLACDLEHHDSPDLGHWLAKQNKYTTAEAIIAYQGGALADEPRLLGTHLQRRMWLKKHFYRVPFRYAGLFAYHYFIQGAWRAGWVGYAWSRLRADVMRLVEYKRREMELTGRLPIKLVQGQGHPDPRVRQYE